MKRNNLFIYTRVSRKLKIDKRGATTTHRHNESTALRRTRFWRLNATAVSVLNQPADTMLFKFRRMSLFQRSKFESCKARSTKHNLKVR